MRCLIASALNADGPHAVIGCIPCVIVDGGGADKLLLKLLPAVGRCEIAGEGRAATGDAAAGRAEVGEDGRPPRGDLIRDVGVGDSLAAGIDAGGTPLAEIRQALDSPLVASSAVVVQTPWVVEAASGVSPPSEAASWAAAACNAALA